METILSFVNQDIVAIGLKVLVSTVILMYCVFSIMIIVQIRALNRTVSMRSFFATRLINLAAILYVLASISLFVLSIVIL